jgi:hypothetical protein
MVIRAARECNVIFDLSFACILPKGITSTTPIVFVTTRGAVKRIPSSGAENVFLLIRITSSARASNVAGTLRPSAFDSEHPEADRYERMLVSWLPAGPTDPDQTTPLPGAAPVTTGQ